MKATVALFQSIKLSRRKLLASLKSLVNGIFLENGGMLTKQFTTTSGIISI